MTYKGFFGEMAQHLFIGVIFCIFAVIAAFLLCAAYSILLTIIFIKVFFIILYEVLLVLKKLFFGAEAHNHVQYEEND